MISNIMEQRQKKIDTYLVKAHKLREKAEEALNRYNEALAKATKEANEEIEKTQKELNEYINSQQQKMSSKLSQEIKDGEAQI